MAYAAVATTMLAAGPLAAQTETTTGTVLREGVSETYVVQRGDTLWDISARFLTDPWRWPDIWHVNPEIENPHLIYPGDIIRLVWIDGEPRLVLEREPLAPRTERLQPRVREMPLVDPIPTIPLEYIRPFLTGAQFITRRELDQAPYLLRSTDGRRMSGSGNRVYARGFDEDPALAWTVVRKGQAYRDPAGRRILGYEAEHVGEARIDRLGDPATVVITSSRQEAMAGDRLIDLSAQAFDAALQPHAPRHPVEGQMVAKLGGGSQIGQYHVVIINRGAEDGLEPGTVLSIWRAGETTRDAHARRGVARLFGSPRVRLPEERIGEMIVFRTDDTLSFGLVMRSAEEIGVGDVVRNP